MLESPQVTLLAHIEEVLLDPSLLRAYGETFTHDDPIVLMIYLPDATPEQAESLLLRLMADEGLDAANSPDILAQALPSGTATERYLTAQADMLYSRRPVAKAFDRLWRVENTASIRQVLDLRCSQPSCEIHVPISDTPSFRTQIRLLAESLRQNGGALSRSKVIVSVGRDSQSESFKVPEWSDDYDITWYQINQRDWEQYGYGAHDIARYEYDYTSDLVLMSDADILFCRPLDDLVAHVLARQAISGLIGHQAPDATLRIHPSPPDTTPRQSSMNAAKTPWRPLDQRLMKQPPWHAIYDACGLPAPVVMHEHTLFGVFDSGVTGRTCPPYFSFSLMVAPADVARTIGAEVRRFFARLWELIETRFDTQIAQTLAIASTGVRVEPMSIRFNFANHQAVLDRYPDEARDARVIHYGSGHIDRVTDLYDLNAVERWLERPAPDWINDYLHLVMGETLAAARRRSAH